jgi:hypothetical protein
MRTMPLRVLTWGTAAAAVTSAIWLSSISQAAILCSLDLRAPGDVVDFEDLAPSWAVPGFGAAPASGSGSGSESRS